MKVERELYDDELIAWHRQRVVEREQHLGAAHFQARGEDGVVDVTLAVGVAVTELIGRLQQVIGKGWRGCHVGHGVWVDSRTLLVFLCKH